MSLWIGVELRFFTTLREAQVLIENWRRRSAIFRWIVPRVAAGFRHASHLTVVASALLLVSTGYLFGECAFSSTVYVSPARTMLLTLSVPSLRIHPHCDSL